MCNELVQTEHKVTSAVQAQGYVRKMVDQEASQWGDLSGALHRIERKYGLPYWTINNIRIGRAKSVDAGLFQRIRAAYLDMCARQIERLQHEIAIERELHGDALDTDLLAEAEALAAKIEAARRLASEKKGIA